MLDGGSGSGVLVAAHDECGTHAGWPPGPMPAHWVQVTVEIQLDGMGKSVGSRVGNGAVVNLAHDVVVIHAP